MRLSFIIPCFNSAATIRRCLDSVYALHLTESEFEVIVVNDGSTDETGKLVEEYGTAHMNLTLIRHLVNRNLGAARNTGLAAAKGDCIAFVDSDDEVGPGLVSALKMMEEKGLDMVAMRVEKVKEDGTVAEELSLPYSNEEVFSGVRLQEERPYWCCAVWGYIYLRAFIDSVNYPFAEGVDYEDSDFVCKHFYRAGRVAYCDDRGYRFYFCNPASITHKSSSKHVFGYAYLGVRMLAFYEELKDKSSVFAKTILEGGSYNIMKSFRRLLRLDSASEVRLFYNMLDSYVDRKSLKGYRKPACCWTFWTRFCLKHRLIASSFLECVISFGGRC